MHRDTLDLGAESAPQHVPVGLFTCQIDPGQHIRLVGRGSEHAAGVEQPRKPLLAAGPAPRRTEFDNATTTAIEAAMAGSLDRRSVGPRSAVGSQRPFGSPHFRKRPPAGLVLPKASQMIPPGSCRDRHLLLRQLTDKSYVLFLGVPVRMSTQLSMETKPGLPHFGDRLAERNAPATSSFA